MKDILIPSEMEIAAMLDLADDREHPEPNPYVVYREKFLTLKDCTVLRRASLSAEPVEQVEDSGCAAKVRSIVPDEIETARVLDKINKGFLSMGEWWDFDLDQVSYSFMTYQDGGEYKSHIDVAPATSRKLSGVVQLSASSEYAGGDLTFHTINDYTVPRTVGTLIVFPAWMMHSVAPVTEGSRHSLVVAAWGPAFR